MTFTKTPPTVTGFYAWRSCKGDDRDFCGNVWAGADGEIWASIAIRTDTVKDMGGEWCRLVSFHKMSEEVEQAYREGQESVLDGLIRGGKTTNGMWEQSRAKKVAEGTI